MSFLEGLGVGTKGATGLREILLIAIFFADGPAETHRNSSNFGSETLATHGSHPQEIVLFAQVEMLIAPVILLQAFF